MKELILYILPLLTSLNLHAQYIPGNSYYGVNQYIEYIAGDMPIIIVAPHAGSLQPTILPDINTRGADNGTMELALFMADSLHLKTGGCRPHIIINHLRPNKLNPVHSATDSTTSAGTNTIALQALNDFHNFIQIAHDKVSLDWGKGHYFELHGNGTAEEWNMIGLGISKTYLNMADSIIDTRVNYSTVKNLCTVGGANFLEVLKGPTSLGGMLDSHGWKSTTSPSYPAPPDSITFFYAGQNTWRYGSKNSGTIDATHLESYWKFMVLSANRSKYSHDLADVMLEFMNIHYGLNCLTINLDEAEYNANRTHIFPNPIQSNALLNIEIAHSVNEILIFNSAGVLCNKLIGNKNQIKINLKQGVYFLVIIDSNGNKTFQKMIVTG
ncbi:MAG: hypothetical protein COA58_13130 [Bacteroidetes bacterium]|nr:MAG: hypothetical protein COA58_13130 [Bacteroidota bacterium]